MPYRSKPALRITKCSVEGGWGKATGPNLTPRGVEVVSFQGTPQFDTLMLSLFCFQEGRRGLPCLASQMTWHFDSGSKWWKPQGVTRSVLGDLWTVLTFTPVRPQHSFLSTDYFLAPGKLGHRAWVASLCCADILLSLLAPSWYNWNKKRRKWLCVPKSLACVFT